MSEENPVTPPQAEPEATETPQYARSAQVRRDEEIDAIREQAKHWHAKIERPEALAPASPRTALTVAGVVLLILLVAGGATLFEHSNHSRALARETAAAAVPTVLVVHPLTEKPDVELALPGSLEAFQESPIYARTNGYLLRWTRDIGSRVKKG